MVEEYSSITPQNCVRKYWQIVKIDSIIEKEDWKMIETLEKILTTICKFTTQRPVSYRSEEAIVEYLYDSVSG